MAEIIFIFSIGVSTGVTLCTVIVVLAERRGWISIND